MHTSYLSYNRGFSPNIWSFIEDTPKGGTIHRLSEKLDEGEIIYQEELFFDVYSETLRTSYDKLNSRIVELFKEHYFEIIDNDYVTSPQIGKGTYHTSKELIRLQHEVDFEWDDVISIFLEKYRNRKNEDSYCNT